MNWIGALILVCTSYFCGRSLASQEGKEIEALDALMGFLKYLRRRIFSERIPLSELFSMYEDEFLEKTGFLPQLRASGRDVNLKWQKALSALALSRETEKELLRFGKELGSISLGEQIKRLDSVIGLLESQKEGLSASVKARQKTVKTVCILCGLLTAIILI